MAERLGDQLAAWAQQGIDRIGVQAVRERAERTAYLDYGERGIGTNTPAESADTAHVTVCRSA